MADERAELVDVDVADEGLPGGGVEPLERLVVELQTGAQRRQDLEPHGRHVGLAHQPQHARQRRQRLHLQSTKPRLTKNNSTSSSHPKSSGSHDQTGRENEEENTTDLNVVGDALGNEFVVEVDEEAEEARPQVVADGDVGGAGGGRSGGGSGGAGTGPLPRRRHRLVLGGGERGERL